MATCLVFQKVTANAIPPLASALYYLGAADVGSPSARSGRADEVARPRRRWHPFCRSRRRASSLRLSQCQPLPTSCKVAAAPPTQTERPPGAARGMPMATAVVASSSPASPSSSRSMRGMRRLSREKKSKLLGSPLGVSVRGKWVGGCPLPRTCPVPRWVGGCLIWRTVRDKGGHLVNPPGAVPPPRRSPRRDTPRRTVRRLLHACFHFITTTFFTFRVHASLQHWVPPAS